MKPFAYGAAHTVAEAVQALSGECWPLAGGTDLVALMKKGLVTPKRLLSIRAIPALGGIEKDEEGWHIGALTTLSDLEGRLEGVPDGELGVLSQAARVSASPQLRHAATIGGNLLQRPRCWYFRNQRTPCWLKGGTRCFAATGKNAYHAILGAGTCHIVHPSDPAVALVALDAVVEAIGPDGRRQIRMAEFFTQPERGARSETVLAADELVTAVNVPAQPQGAQGVYIKVAERAAWDFALVSAAVQIKLSGGAVERARVVLGGVAPMPWRAQEAEGLLIGHSLSEEAIDSAGPAASSGAAPLSRNGYKVRLIEGVVREALRRLHQSQGG